MKIKLEEFNNKNDFIGDSNKWDSKWKEAFKAAETQAKLSNLNERN